MKDSPGVTRGATHLHSIRGFASFPSNPCYAFPVSIHPRGLDLPRRNGLDTRPCHELAPVLV